MVSRRPADSTVTPPAAAWARIRYEPGSRPRIVQAIAAPLSGSMAGMVFRGRSAQGDATGVEAQLDRDGPEHIRTEVRDDDPGLHRLIDERGLPRQLQRDREALHGYGGTDGARASGDRRRGRDQQR